MTISDLKKLLEDKDFSATDKRLDQALDKLYDYIDEYLRKSQFGNIDQFLLLAIYKIKSLSTDLILGILTTILPAKSKLHFHRKFFRIAREELIRRKMSEVESLLSGLN